MADNENIRAAFIIEDELGHVQNNTDVEFWHDGDTILKQNNDTLIFTRNEAFGLLQLLVDNLEPANRAQVAQIENGRRVVQQRRIRLDDEDGVVPPVPDNEEVLEPAHISLSYDDRAKFLRLMHEFIDADDTYVDSALRGKLNAMIKVGRNPF